MSEDLVVEVLDAIMGSGKSTGIFKWMDTLCHKEKFIYVSPLDSEVGENGRVHKDCKIAKFNSPTTECYDTKSDHLFELLSHGYNVACTHALYLIMTQKHFDEIQKQGYIVVIDEELGVIKDYADYSDSDLESLLSLGCISKRESDGMLEWIKEDQHFDNKNHKYYTFKRHVENGMIYSAKRKNSMMVTQLPVKLFSVAKRCIILTYMFEGNVLSSFLTLKNIKYKKFDEFEPNVVDKNEIKSLITLHPLKGKWVKIQDFKLSNTWYVSGGKGNASSEDITLLQKYIETFARQTGCTYKTLMYTFPKYRKWTETNGVKRVIKPTALIDRIELDGKEEKCWIPVQTRATNLYAHKTHLLHLYNRYPNQSVKAYLQDYGVDINDDVFALSELVQWLWRSAIRNKKPITVCIASPRMLKLFQSWLIRD